MNPVPVTAFPAPSLPAPLPRPSAPARLPWRSARLGWLAAAALLAVGVPLFMRMPLWIDATLYDVAVRAILSGGTHYRDVFDTNTPGFVWALCVVRVLFGPSIEAARAADLAVVAAATALLLRWARAGGATAAGAAWAAAGVAGFYLFVSEFNHCQRDVWMLLPVAAAAACRLARVGRARERSATDGWVFRTAFAEALLWGAAVWIKPHVVVVAAAAWAAVQGRLAGSVLGGWKARARRSAADLGGSLAGGLLVGAAGFAWLAGTGAWPYFWDVFTTWNREYFAEVIDGIAYRWECQLEYFPPWSLLFVPAVPLAVLNVVDARVWAVRDGRPGSPGPVARLLPGWLYDPPAGADARAARGLLAAVFLAWAAMAYFLQKEFHYAHVPETLLMIALFAANRWAVVVPALVLQFAAMAWLTVAPPAVPWDDRPTEYRHLVWRYPDRDTNRVAWWPRCVTGPVDGGLRNGVAFQSDFFAGIDWRELDEVAAFLRSRGVREGDGTVLCWNDSTHPLYLSMNLRQPIRFMHLTTAAHLDEDRVREETTAAVPEVRFVVSDLRRVALFYPDDMAARMSEPGPGPDLLPPVVSRDSRTLFPLTQPTVFRSGGGRGRYVVHERTAPLGIIAAP